jgi:hypothetical protein
MSDIKCCRVVHGYGGLLPLCLPKIPVNGSWGDSARTLLSSGCHVTELREGTWTLAQNFGRTVGVVSAGS